MFMLASVVPVVEYVLTRASRRLLAGLDCDCSLVLNYMIVTQGWI